MKQMKLLLIGLISVLLLGGCGMEDFSFSNLKNIFSTQKNKDETSDGGSYGHYNEDGEFEISEEELFKILDEIGYGEGVDWSKQSDDDPSIPKDMDITASREAIQAAYTAIFTDAYEPGDMYEKAWWDWIPDSYDLSGDVFLATPNYAGQEKQYNNSLEQGAKDELGYTSGQRHDLSNVEHIAKTFIYETMKNRYQWMADLDQLCKVADSFGVATFYSRESERPVLGNDGEERLSPGFMTAHYDQKITGYTNIGIPVYGGYAFTITVWEVCDEPVGWVNELENNAFLNPDEVYENMGEWDFYDTLDATDKPTKVEKPDLPNGAMIVQNKKGKLSKEQYIYCDIGNDCGTLYYYGNGITIDMSIYGGDMGGSFQEGLEMCRKICGN